MCLAVPGKVVALDRQQGQVNFGQIKARVRFDLVPEVKLEDWVIVHAGYAIEILSDTEARDTLELIAEFQQLGDGDGK